MTVTLNSSWKATNLGVTFPAGTIFLLRMGSNDVWSYTCPNGSHGECYLEDQIPGK